MHALLAALLLAGGAQKGTPGHTGKGSAGGAFTNQFSTTFDGTNDYLVIPTGATTDMTGAPNGREITISIWAKRTANPGSFCMLFTNRYNGSANTQYIVSWETSNAGYNFYGGIASAAQGAAAGTGSWMHIVGRVADESGTKKYRVATNGTLSAASNAGASTETATKWLSGCRWGAADMSSVDGCFTGSIDEISVWSVGLSQAQITELYNNGKPSNLLTHSAAANLKHWWRMGDGAGDVYPTIRDQVGTADGTLTNMAGAANITTDIP